MNSTQIQIPPPSGEILSLITTLSNPTHHQNHTNALNLLNQTLSTSPTTYSQTCLQFARVVACPSPDHLLQAEIEKWSASDGGVSVMQLRHDPVGGWGQMREMAGLLLKNALVKPPVDANTKMRMRLLAESRMEMKQVLCQCVVDQSAGVRRVGSSIIASCTVGKEADGMEPLPLKDWGEGILGPFLMNCLESAIGVMENGSAGVGMTDNGQFALLGSLQTLTKVLEDDAEKFERGTGAAFNRIIPCLLKLLKICGEERVKVDSLKCCVHLVLVMPGSLIAQMNNFLGVLSSLAGDNSVEVRKLVCRAIVTLLSFRPEHLHEHMLPVSQFILASTSDGNEEVALEACEFWLVFASLDETMCTAGMMAVVESLLPQLLPTLVKSMVYSEEKREELLEQNAADEQQGDDRAQDVAPVFHRSKAKGGARKDDESDDDDDDDNYDDEKEWGLRTCAAASLDSLASGYAADRTLSILLPVLQECLSHADPWVREAGILALGAIEEGCAEEMYEHLNQLHPYLMSQVTNSDTLPQVVCISCWSLAKYSTWAVERAASGVQPDLVQKLTEAIAGRILDRNRKVQVASCSALGIFMENTGDMIIPYLEPIYKTLVLALERHQTRALLVTLETFGSMAEVIGPATGEGNLPNIYLPPLLQMWSQKAKKNPMDRTLLPLMESLASISMIIGMSFQPWSLETFENAMSTVNAAIMILSVDVYTDEEADPMVCATDVLDGLVEGLGSNFAELVSSSAQYKDHFLTLLKTLVGHDVEGVRMSAFALMGDIAIQCPVVMQDGMSELITEAILCIDATFPSVCNNAVWAIGEVLVKCVGNPAAIQPFATEIVQNLISLIMGSKYNGHEYNPISGLIENASTAMGRLAKVNPAFVATDLPRFLRGWVEGCAKVDDFSERRDAFEGLLLAIQVNPNSIKQAGPDLTETISVFLLAIMSWHVPKGNISPELLSGNYAFTKFPQEHADLHHHLGTFAHQFLKINGEAWGQVTNNLPVNVRRLLQEQYNL